MNELSFFELIKKGVSVLVEIVDAFARSEIERVEALVNGLSEVARTGSYNDLSDKPTIPVVPDISEVGLTGEYGDLLNKPTLFSGDYNDLTNKPTLFSGDYNDLTNKPNLSAVATSGSYNDLSNKPTIPSNTNQLTNGANFIAMVTNTDVQSLSTAQMSAGYSTSLNAYVIQFNFADNSWFRLEMTTTNIRLRNSAQGIIWTK